MRSAASSFHSVIWLVILTVLAVRLSDAHLHLCFDGMEPPASVHVADESMHGDDEHHESDGSADQDVSLVAGAFVKKVGSDVDLTAVVVAVFIGFLAPVLRAVPSVRTRHILVVPVPFTLRPPLRGPPR